MRKLTEIITESLAKSTFTKSDKKMFWVPKIKRKREKEEKNKGNYKRKCYLVVNGILLIMLPYRQKWFPFFNARENVFAKMPSGTLFTSK